MTLDIGESQQNAVVKNLCKINILDLPTELIFKILIHVPTKDLLLNIAQTSKAFCHYTKNPGIYQCVSVSLPQSTSDLESARLFLKNAVLLEELYIKPDYSSIILSRYGGQNKNDNLDDLEKILSGILEHRLLKVLSISYIVSTKCLTALGKAKWWPYLTKIALALGPNTNPSARAGVYTVFNSFENSENLQCLGVSMPSSNYLPLALSCKNLNNLYLDSQTTEYDSISVLTKRKDNLKGLRILTDLSPKALVRISEFFKLTSLDIQIADFKSF